jgi:hypothetical protein
MSRVHRAMSCCLIVGLCLQLYALTQHHHALTAHPDDCVACHLTALTSGGGIPPASPVVMAAPFVQALPIAVQHACVVLPSCGDFIHPYPQAPPRV